MTYEEFEALALSPPRRDEETIFEVIEYDVKDLPGRKRSHYPKFDVRYYRVGICHTLPEAEALMHKSIERAKGYNDEIYCFHIKEYPMGELLDFIWENYGESWRLYDGQGQFIDKTYCSALECDHRTIYGRYRGRPEESFRFKEGDIVEVLDGDEVRLAVATGSGRSIEWYWEMWQRIKKKEGFIYTKNGCKMTDNEVEEAYFPDASDDQTPVIDGPSYATHDHVHTLNIMPLRYPLPDKLRKKYEGFYQAMLIEEEEYIRQCEQENAEQKEQEEKILSICKEYNKWHNDLSPRKALLLLADCYIAYCGISISLRTIAYDAANFWIKQLAMSDDPLAIKAKSAKVFMDIMPELSEELAANKAYYYEYDITPLCKSESIDAMAELLANSNDDNLKIALSTGFLDVFKYYHE